MVCGLFMIGCSCVLYMQIVRYTSLVCVFFLYAIDFLQYIYVQVAIHFGLYYTIFIYNSIAGKSYRSI